MPPVELPFQRIPCEIAVPREEIASSRLPLEAEIDQFQFGEENKELANPIINLPDSEDELDRHSAAHSPKLVTARVDSASIEEVEMSLDNKKKGLRELLKDRVTGP